MMMYILEADWVKWYRISNFQIEVWQDDLKEHFNILLLDSNKDRVFDRLGKF